MPFEKALINASPLILLCKIGLAELLPQIFQEIIVPEAVHDEVSRGTYAASRQIYDYELNWLTRGSIIVAPEIAAWNLGDGESEVLSCALQNKGFFAAMIDDRAARRCAKTFDIQTLETGGFLILAKQKKFDYQCFRTTGKSANRGLMAFRRDSRNNSAASGRNKLNEK